MLSTCFHFYHCIRTDVVSDHVQPRSCLWARVHEASWHIWQWWLAVSCPFKVNNFFFYFLSFSFYFFLFRYFSTAVSYFRTNYSYFFRCLMHPIHVPLLPPPPVTGYTSPVYSGPVRVQISKILRAVMFETSAVYIHIAFP